MGDSPESFREFWPEYVLGHRKRGTRCFHVAGTLASWLLLAAAVTVWQPWLLLAALLIPYALAWLSHFSIEHNLPASFRHPLWSWVADQKMLALTLTGKMAGEVSHCEKLQAGGGPEHLQP